MEIKQRMEIKLIEDCKQLMPAGFIFQREGAPAHTARVTQEWLHANCPEIIEKDRWPPNSPDFNPLDYHVWGPCWKGIYHKLQLIWDDMPQEPINKIVKDFTKRLKGMRTGQWWTL